MQVYYDSADSNQVQAVYDGDTSSTRWAAFSKIEVTDAGHKVSLRQFGRNSRLTIVDSEVTVVTQFDHPGDNTLPKRKRKKMREIDRRTNQLIGDGFVHSTFTFSLSRPAQHSLTQMHSTRGDLVYPKTLSSKNNLNAITIAGAPAMKTFCEAGLGTVQGHRDTGNVLKDQVRAATTVAEVDAVVDNR